MTVRKEIHSGSTLELKRKPERHKKKNTTHMMMMVLARLVIDVYFSIDSSLLLQYQQRPAKASFVSCNF